MNKIYIVQHCQSEHHINDLTGGWTDTPLTKYGLEQAHKVVSYLASLGLNDFILYSSDLKRAKMTAEVIANKYKTKIVETNQLREINNGIAANKTKEWAKANRLTKADKLCIDQPLWDEAETSRDLYGRLKTFIKENLLNIDKDIIIVSHGIAIGYLISIWLDIPINNMEKVFIKGNAGGVSILSENCYKQRVLNQFNSTNHL